MEKPNWILQRTSLSSDQTALIDLHTEDTWTYAKLEKSTMKWVSYMQQQGLTKGDRVVLLATNRIELFSIIFACGVMGIIYVPLNYRLSLPEMSALVTDSDPALLLHDDACEELAGKLGVVSASIEEAESYPVATMPLTDIKKDDPWLIIYTGGTTGKPKGVVLSHRAVNANAVNTIISWSLSEEDTTINYMPLFHTGGINALCVPLLMAGGTVVIGSQFAEEEALKVTNKYEATISLFVPTMYHLMTQTAYFERSSFTSMRAFISGAAPCPATIYERFREKGIPFKEGYGLTEAGPNNFFIRPEMATVKRGSVGKNMLFNEVKIVRDDGNPCMVNEIGELLLKGEHVFTKYWNLEETTQETFLNGWLKTGDLAKFDEDGDYYIVGRKKDMIISGGENIYPQEVEQCLNRLHAISEAAVVGIPDRKWGEITVAFISKYGDEHVTVTDIKEHCEQFLGNYKIPKEFIILTDLPKTDVGKIDKNKLIELVENGEIKQGK